MAASQQDIRTACINAQTRARAIELRLEQVRGELDNLQSVGLGSLLSALQGRRSAQIAAANELHRQLEQQQAEALAALTDLQRQVAALGEVALIAQPVPGPDTRLAEPDDLVARIERAMQAGQEALRDVRDEIETMCMRSRFPIPKGRSIVLRVLAHTATGMVAGNCAGRVSQSLRRFAESIGPALTGSDFDAELMTAQRDIEQAATDFSGSSLRSSSQCDALLLRLQTADMLLERKMMDATKA